MVNAGIDMISRTLTNRWVHIHGTRGERRGKDRATGNLGTVRANVQEICYNLTMETEGRCVQTCKLVDVVI
jgi:hypothetical protein